VPDIKDVVSVVDDEPVIGQTRAIILIKQAFRRALSSISAKPSRRLPKWCPTASSAM
jgi:hypothetical protein